MILGGSTALLLATTIGLGGSLLVTKNDLRQAQKEADRVPTLVRDLDTCQNNGLALSSSLSTQTAAVAQLQADKTRIDAQGRERLAAERARTAASEKRRQSLLQAQARPGESDCDAAFRIHQENLR